MTGRSSIKPPVIAGGIAALIGAGTLAALFPPLGDAGAIADHDDDDFVATQEMFARQLAGDPVADDFVARAGFTRQTMPDAPGTVLMAEEPGQCGGRGVYWLRHDGAPIALTAPHRGSDRNTGALAAALFAEMRASGAAWNSAPRRANDTCGNAIDLAQVRTHPFSAFALAFAQTFPRGLVVQLHGFEVNYRDDVRARDAAMILSDGSQTPPDRLRDLADCLSIAFAPASVLLYPGDTRELGATGNAQGQLLREVGFDGFVHIELSAQMRTRLVSDAAERATFARCLSEVAQ